MYSASSAGAACELDWFGTSIQNTYIRLWKYSGCVTPQSQPKWRPTRLVVQFTYMEALDKLSDSKHRSDEMSDM